MDQKKTEHGQSAFVLAQVGAHASAQFAQRIGELELAPSDAGVLRILRMNSRISQQELSGHLHIHPRRLVSLLDKLERSNLIERRQNPADRRLYSLYLTEAGAVLFEKVGQLARQHQQAMSTGLSTEENDTLTTLLRRIAQSQGLTPGVHPGYQKLQEDKTRREGVQSSPSTPAEARKQAAAQPSKARSGAS
jgi:DNA-binding MarR family transcriptional regulator